MASGLRAASNALGRPLGIGFVSQGFWPDAGGIEAHLWDLARGLAQRGHRVHVLCLDRSGDRWVPYSCTIGQVGSVRVKCMRPALEHRALIDLVSDRRAEDVAEEWLEYARLDVVHVHHASGFGAGVIARLASWGVLVAVTLHDHWYLCPCGQLLHDPADAAANLACIRRYWPHLLPSGGGEPRGLDGEALTDDADALAARDAAVRSALAHARLVLAPAPGVLRAHALLGVDAARTRVIEHGMDAGAIAAAVQQQRAWSPRPAGGPVRLGVLGSVLPATGVVELAEAFLESRTETLRLEVHGPLVAFHGDASHLERLRQLAQRSERIALHGAYAPGDLPRVLAGLDAVAAPAVWDEVYGLSVREARAAGLPVLVSDRGGLPPAAQGGRAGRVLPAGDRSAWAEALRELERDDAQRARWSAEPCELRSVAEMAADHERAYLDAVFG